MRARRGRKVWVTGLGQTPVGEHWDRSLRDLAAAAAVAALRDGGLGGRSPHGRPPVDAVVVGNMLSGILSRQENLGAFVADASGLCGVEAFKVEGACASGGAAIRAGFSLLASGLCERVLVVGVEKMTDVPPEVASAALATAADADYESVHGLSFAAIGALLTQAYMHAHGYERSDFAAFPLNAHGNAVTNANAMFRRAVSEADYLASPLVATPLGVLDSSPVCDGAAAMVLSTERPSAGLPAIGLVGSGSSTDTVSLATRLSCLRLNGAEQSANIALDMAGLALADLSLFELHDAFPIMAALSLEAVGFAAAGEGVKMARAGGISLTGPVPIQTMGGCKARGHPVGATGVYQGVEACLQLRGQAGANQVFGAHAAMTQSIGGSGALVVTHIFRRES